MNSPFLRERVRIRASNFAFIIPYSVRLVKETLEFLLDKSVGKCYDCTDSEGAEEAEMLPFSTIIITAFGIYESGNVQNEGAHSFFCFSDRSFAQNGNEVTNMRTLTDESIDAFRIFLAEEERAQATIEKYLHDVRTFAAWLGGNEFDKSTVLLYKRELLQRGAVLGVNSCLSALNRFFDFCGFCELKVKTVKVQRESFSKSERELSKNEYNRLLLAAKERKKERLQLVMQTICSCGIRVSELKFITVEAANSGRSEIACKGKRRTVFLPEALCRILKRYAVARGIKKGPVFVTRNGKPLDRSNIWLEMKKLCRAAGVSEKKVFPHNLRHLFARTYYTAEKDIVRLADILGHSSINTTRIYTMESGEVHRRQIQKLGLLGQNLRNIT